MCTTDDEVCRLRNMFCKVKYIVFKTKILTVLLLCRSFENDHNSSLSLKPSSNLELLVNQFNNATPENSNDPEKFLHLNIMTLRKCITLKYLTQINHYPYSI